MEPLMANEKKVQQYTEDQIEGLEGREAVRTRPAMYISNTDALGLHHLVWEVVDNSIDEAMGGHCDFIDVKVHFDNSITITDNGRGIPVGPHKDPKFGGRSTLELVLTVLHMGGKFKKEAYKFSGGLHGVGISVVAFLSEWLEAETGRSTSCGWRTAAYRRGRSRRSARTRRPGRAFASSRTRESSRRPSSTSTSSRIVFARWRS
jgi:DNA gyrase subunit B